MNKASISADDPTEWRKVSRVMDVQGASPATAVIDHSAVFFEERKLLVVFGGYRPPGKVSASVHELDMDTKNWTSLHNLTPSPSPRCLHSAVLLGSKMIVFGGSDNDQQMPFGDTWSYDVETKRWEHVDAAGSWPSARCGHAVSRFENDCFFLFGGFDGKNRLSDFYKFTLFNNSSTQQGEWSEINCEGGPIPAPRDGHTLCTANGVIYLFGGYADAKSSELYSYNSKLLNQNIKEDNNMPNVKWNLITFYPGHSPSARFHHAAVVAAERLFILQGCDGGMLPSADSFEFDINSAKWKRCDWLGEAIGPWSNHSAVLFESEHRIICFGGWDGNNPSKSPLAVYEYAEFTENKKKK